MSADTRSVSQCLIPEMIYTTHSVIRLHQCYQNSISWIMNLILRKCKKTFYNERKIEVIYVFTQRDGRFWLD